MSTSTTERDEFKFDEDFGFEDDAPIAEVSPGVADYSTTTAVAGVIIYTHGCSVRLSFSAPTPNVLEALRRCEWVESPADATTWFMSTVRGGARRYLMRGSKWLSERAPANKRLPLEGLNREWKTKLYSLSVEVREGVHIDLQVVRHGDIRRFVEDVLGLRTGEYAIDYYRTAERFMVLPPHEAHRLAAALGVASCRGKGRLSRKHYLVKDYEMPLTIRRNGKAVAKLIVYRIDRGATAAYKVEIQLRGLRSGRGQFGPADILKLDRMLLDLVDKYDLHPVPKPARWEPRTFTTAAERGPFQPHLQRLPQRAWRGSKVSKATKAVVAKCHTPSWVRLVVGAETSGAFRPRPRIRTNLSSRSSGSTTWIATDATDSTATRYERVGQAHEETRTKPRTPWTAIVRDIAGSSLYLSEVVLDHEQSPRSLLDALANGDLGTIGVGALCAVGESGNADTWLSVIEAANRYPFEGRDVDTVVLAVDPSVVLDVADAVVKVNEPAFGSDGRIDAHTEMSWEPGPLVPPVPDFDPMPLWWRATGAWLFDLFGQLRLHCEQTGLRVVVITADARPDHGRGPLLRSHFFRDGRVRSIIGDAGRYYCHQRYLVEGTIKRRMKAVYTETVEDGDEIFVHEYDERTEDENVVGSVVVMKDEAEGLVGRMIYER